MSTATAPFILRIDGAGSGTCNVCQGKLDYSWVIRYDGGSETRCSMDLPRTSKPSPAEYENYRRWAIAPLATPRQFWVKQEAQAIFRARTGRADPWPSSQDYKQASKVIPGGEA